MTFVNISYVGVIELGIQRRVDFKTSIFKITPKKVYLVRLFSLKKMIL